MAVTNSEEAHEEYKQCINNKKIYKRRIKEMLVSVIIKETLLLISN